MNDNTGNTWNPPGIAARIAALGPEQRALLDRRLAALGRPAPQRPPAPATHGADGIALSFAQQRLWLLDRLLPGGTEYNTALAAQLHGALDIDALRRAVNEVVRRHDVLREDTPGDRRLVAYVATRGDDLPAADLRAHVKRFLPGYMVPAAFVLLPELPLTRNGKVDRNALPKPECGGDEPEREPPRTPMEKALTEVMADVLHLDRIGINDNFFDLGGHSLSAVRLVNRIRDVLHVDLSLRQFFDAPTAHGLCLAATLTLATEATLPPSCPPV